MDQETPREKIVSDNGSSVIPIIGIGASAGGLEAIREMLSAAELPTGMAYVIVQHLDPNHESMLAELLNRQTNLDVQQVSGGEKVEADNVYIIPPGHGLELKNGVLTLTEFEQPRGLRRPIDDFFESMAYDWTVNAACVILSGTGADGAIGLRAVKECGGVCLAQEPVTARYDGMPLAAVGTGLVDYVKRPAEMIDTLSDFFSRRSNSVGDEEISRVVSDHIDDVCNSLSELIGHDFSDYKRSTLERRVERRMQVLGIDDPQAYLQRVRKDEDECDALFRDLLINVTRFFRDNEHFDQLMTDVIKPLVAESRSTGEIRVWVAGCSSGEEAYSIAMLLHEKMRETATRPLVQIFATDIDESMLAIAREGRYPSASLTDIPEELRDRYTIGHGVDFQISPIIRDMIRFSSHSLIKDPPFAKIDLLSCRNLLIYFGERLQKSVLPLMHYSIRPGGYLFLGPSETVGRYEDLFAPIDARSRIFKRRPGSIRHPIDLPMGNNRSRRQSSGSQPGYSGKKDWQEEEVTRRIADRYAPASVLIDADGNVLTSYGRLSRYLEFPTGEGRQVSVLNLARGDLRRVLPSLMRDASSKDRRVVANGIEIKSEFGTQKVDLIADPVMDGHVLLIFRDREPFKQEYDEDLLDLNQADDQVQVLEDELRSTRNRLRTTVEELETANEELKSSNEEMMSMNDELQSTNEELSTVNDELKSKVDQLTVANADLMNFFDSTQLAVVVLDEKLQIRSYTEAACEIFPLKSTDKGRHISEIVPTFDHRNLVDDVRDAMQGEKTVTRRLTSRDGKSDYAMRALPYKSLSGDVQGATVVFTDISESLALERALAEQRERLELAIQVGGVGVWELNVESGVVILDDNALGLMELNQQGLIHLDTLMAMIIEEDLQDYERALRHTISGQRDFDITFRIRTPEGEMRCLRQLGRQLDGAQQNTLVGVVIDVSAEYEQAAQRDLMIREMNHRVKNLFAIIGSMVSLASRQFTDVRQMGSVVREQIAALGRAHSLSVGADDKDPKSKASLENLISQVIEPYSTRHEIKMTGEEILVPRTVLSPLALILHEWATNSVKYGVFQSKNGSLDISWERKGDRATLYWDETNPEFDGEIGDHRGFGSTLVRLSVSQIEGELEPYPEPGRYKLALSFSLEVD